MKRRPEKEHSSVEQKKRRKDGENEEKEENENKKRKVVQVQYPKGEPRSFQAMCKVITDIMNRQLIPSKTVLHKSKLKLLKSRVEERRKNRERVQMQSLCHVLPTSENSDKTLERELALIATSSVVQLFTRIKKHQKETGTAPEKKPSHWERKAQLREQRRTDTTSSSGMLFRSNSTSANSKLTVPKKNLNRSTKSKEKTWSVLDDNYLPI